MPQKKDTAQSEEKKTKGGLKLPSMSNKAARVVHRAAVAITRRATKSEIFKFEPERAAQVVSRDENFNKIKEITRDFINSYNSSHPLSLSKEYRLKNLISGVGETENDSIALLAARMDFIKTLCQKIREESNAPDNPQKPLAAVFAEALARGYSLDDTKNAHRLNPGTSLEKELTDFITNLSNMMPPPSKKIQITMPHSGKIDISELDNKNIPVKQEEKTHFIVKLFQKIMTFFFKNSKKKNDKKNKFNNTHFGHHQKAHLPDMLLVLNHFLRSTSAQDKKAHEELMQLAEITLLKKELPQGMKKFGPWVENLLQHFKQESVSNDLSKEEKILINRRNNGRAHLLQVALVQIFPKLADNLADLDVLTKELQTKINAMGVRDDLMALTPKMIKVLRQDKYRDSLIEAVGPMLFKAFNYDDNDLIADRQRNANTCSSQNKQKKAQEHFAIEFLNHVLQSPQKSNEDIAQLLKSLSEKKKDPLKILTQVFVNKGQVDKAFIDKMILAQPSTFVTFMAKTLAKTSNKDNKPQQKVSAAKLQAELWDVFKEPGELKSLAEGLSTLARGYETKNQEEIKHGIETLLNLLPTLNEKIIQHQPPLELTRIIAEMLFKNPKKPHNRSQEALAQAKVALLQRVCQELSQESYAETRKALASTLASYMFAKSLPFPSKLWNLVTSGGIGTALSGLPALCHNLSSSLEAKDQETLAECYPKISTVLSSSALIGRAQENITSTLGHFKNSFLSMLGITVPKKEPEALPSHDFKPKHPSISLTNNPLHEPESEKHLKEQSLSDLKKRAKKRARTPPGEEKSRAELK